MQFHNLKKNTSARNSTRIGRGGKRGKTSGRGGKGQTARAGNSTRPEIRDMIKKIPKLRGQGKNGNKNKAIINKYVALNLSDLEAKMDAGVININSIVESGLVSKRMGKNPAVKILSRGDVTKKFNIEGLPISSSAKEKIEKAGGSVK